MENMELPGESKVYPVKKGGELLDNPSYRNVLSELLAMTKLDRELFNAFYYDLIENFAEFVQLLPQPQVDSNVTMLANAVRRAYILLEVFCKDQIGIHGKPFVKSDEGSRLLYGVFSAALLFEVGNVCTDRVINLCSEKGHFRAQWLYFDKAMPVYGDYFKIRYAKGMVGDLIPQVTYILAQRLMPKVGFAWIAEDCILLRQWFQALIALEEFFGSYQIELEVEKVLKDHSLEIEDIEDDSYIPEDMVEAEAFLKWLKEKIASEKTSVSEEGGPIQIVDGRLLLDMERLTTEFGRVFSRFSGKVILSGQFNYLGLAAMSGDDPIFYKYYSSPLDKSKVSGVHQGLFNTGSIGTGGSSKDLVKRDHVYIGIDKNIARSIIPGYDSLPEAKNLQAAGNYSVIGSGVNRVAGSNLPMNELMKNINY